MPNETSVVPHAEPEVAILSASSPSLRAKLHRARVSLHHRCPTWGHYCESACAGAYAVHEVFHFSAFVIATAYGLLFVLILHIVTYTRESL